MISDNQLRHDVEAELDWDARIDSRDVGVAVRNGIVSLSGHVGSYLERRAAEQAAQSVEGVKAVANDIHIELPLEAKRSDSQIAEAAVTALQSHVSVPSDKIKIYVREGWITLEGEVSTWYQKDSAETALSALHGVKGVTNNVVIRSRTSIEDVQSRIAEAFRRRAQLDAKNVRVLALDGTVTLEGEVGSWHERDQAEIAAWQAPGVSRVVDKLTVQP
jgi:osmotically-inducible protein OsmY